ncbi:DUF1896 family protein [Sphingobacterium sp.]
MKILPQGEGTFGRYEPADDFTYTTDYVLLYVELSGFIEILRVVCT